MADVNQLVEQAKGNMTPEEQQEFAVKLLGAESKEDMIKKLTAKPRKGLKATWARGVTYELMAHKLKCESVGEQRVVFVTEDYVKKERVKS